MNLYETIYARRSVRSYVMEPLEDKIFEQLYQFKNELVPLFPDIVTRIEVIDNIKNPGQIKGVFRVRAPYYLAVYSEEKEKYQLNAGFLMEQISLYLGSKGIGSCFLGATQKKKRNDSSDNGKFVIMMAIGKPKGDYARPDYEARRMDLSELCVYKENPKTWVKEVLEAARLSPSDLNSQPWRFVVYENRIHVFEKKPKLYVKAAAKWSEFDFGIMLAHVMVVAEERWIDIDIIKLGNITHKTVPNNQYVISIILKP
jgi:nitroreductase